MNLNPFTWIGGGKTTSNIVLRSGSQGPWAQQMQFVAREINPRLYEVCREAIPVIDAAINKTVTLDGIVRIEANSDAMQNAIQDWADNVQVNDMDHGLQAYYTMQSNELYEQGYAIGEPVLSRGGKDVSQLKVGDSKGFYFRRNGKILETWYRPPAQAQACRKDGTEPLEKLLRNNYEVDVLNMLQISGYRKLSPSLLNYTAINNEADNPYGVSKIRSLEFVSKVIATLINSQQQTWERFGNPSFNLTYKRKKPFPATDPQGLQFINTLKTNLAAVLSGKQDGKSRDFINAIAAGDDLVLDIIGASGEILPIDVSARFVLEQVISKFDLAPWILGFVWGTAERLAERQIDMMLQSAKTRFESRRLGLANIVAMAMRARGMKWKAGDWQLAQELPNLKDELAMAQAEFMHAQAVAVSGGNLPQGGPQAPKLARVNSEGKIITPIDPGYDNYPLQVLDPFKSACGCGEHKNPAVPGGPSPHGISASMHVKAPSGEQYVTDGPALMRLEATATRGLLNAWGDLYDSTLKALGLEKPTKAPDPAWAFDPATMLPLLQSLRDEFIASVSRAEAPLAGAVYDAWVRGVTTAADELGQDAVETSVRDATRQALVDAGLAQVTDTTIRAMSDDIIATLSQGAYDGLNPTDVARALRNRFDAHAYDWERLARSEIATANSRGHMDQYEAQDIAEYDWMKAGGACPICVGLAENGPYQVGQGPLPAQDSHPNCRCGVAAKV